ncbi:hypothetical protein IF1G_04310 [Cordyceps javanica]|uniref:Uncharacterized protein n=1 Tax=Cordyceps javanica TaxID=43265 RepID=A0A545V5S8_9HYPO|nr:hypothetical protein IF1G_04310 [Cordyceps javanica]
MDRLPEESTRPSELLWFGSFATMRIPEFFSFCSHAAQYINAGHVAPFLLSGKLSQISPYGPVIPSQRPQGEGSFCFALHSRTNRAIGVMESFSWVLHSTVTIRISFGGDFFNPFAGKTPR